MDQWEFLLQKEGDRSWLPLDAPDVEILEGRYRIVARSSRHNTDVEVRITHLAMEENPPRRRVQKRVNRTSATGLLVVAPFTKLEPGSWDFRCASVDLMSDLVGNSWAYTIKLQVSAKDVEGETWEPAWTHDLVMTQSESMELGQSEAARVSQTPAKDDSVVHVNFTDASRTSTNDPLMAEAEPTQTDQLDPIETSQIPANSTLDAEVSSVLPDVTPIAQSTTEPSQPDSEADPALPSAPVEPSTLPPEVAEILAASMDRLFQIADQMSTQLIDEVLQEFDLKASSTASNPQPASPTLSPIVVPTHHELPLTPTPSIAPTNHDTSESYVVQDVAAGVALPAGVLPLFRLERDTLIATQGQPLTLGGNIDLQLLEQGSAMGGSGAVALIADPWDTNHEAAPTLIAHELQLCLRDPQTLQILLSARQPLPNQSFPFTFQFTFSLPEGINTHLILGEVLLCGTMPGRGNDLTTLTSQAFTITAHPAELVDQLEKINDVLDDTLTQTEERDRINLPLEICQRLAQEQERPVLQLSFLEPEPEKIVANLDLPERLPSLKGQSLPPQIYHPSPEQAGKRAIALPGFGSNQSNPAPDLDSVSEPELASSVTADGSEVTDIAELAVEAIAPTDGEQSSMAIVPLDNPFVSEDLDTVDAEADAPSPIQMAFQSLRLQDRFLDRLNSIANDMELSDWLRANLYPGKVASTSAAQTSNVAKSLAEEIVVDDEPQERVQRRVNHRSKATVTMLEPNPLILPEDEPVPVPRLEVTAGELVAGQLVNVRVRLPYLQPRIYVKLWITDRQNRSLLDGPRWLLDFFPNSANDLEATTQLTVPFGSLEVRFEAIAIEIHTQRESHKVSVDRHIVPPDLPVVSLDDFNA